MARAWTDQLHAKLLQDFGASKGAALSKKYAPVFSATYQEDFSANEAVDDIKLIELLSENDPLKINLYEPHKNKDHRYYLKLIQFEKPIPLSDILPMLENMDLRTFNERLYKIVLNNKTIWISDFSVAPTRSGVPIKLSEIREIFQDALIMVTQGICENDAFNKLILDAELPWREIMILRGYARYLQQINFRFSQAYIARTLANYPGITHDMIALFKLKFDPTEKPTPKQIEDQEDNIKQGLEKVLSLDEDRILRTVLALIQTTLRTNYFQTTKEGDFKDYFSFKLFSKDIPDIPLPYPLYEVFVYSSRFEAVHLRAEKVARGGIRWSDRLEDFRTEILGLMKAQKVKNAIIVPSGAKGGFVLKKNLSMATREELQTEVLYCYKSFMRGLLDITDNIINGKIISPPSVVCYDKDDPYLVVAADKGTATFSDVANAISKEYDFWLGDAFASGGSAGYDHKKMGITARGAWESIKRHFHTLSVDIQEEPFTCVGIGDMSGDVFGNGMLRSHHTRLVAAFDHRDIFLDPTPHAEKSFAERKRLFNLPASSWQDYDKKLISKGGGVYSRRLKSIEITPQVKKVLGIEENALTPNDLIRAVLKAPVDLLYNGGIGTYVKATHESQADVGDKSNEFTRVNGDDLRCRVVGEGGNLGFTQLGRIEYALKGGLINTDFIDNSGGVDCSDHEVNMKILLNHEVKIGKLTEASRNKFLASMTDEVAVLVLEDNYNQAITMAFSVDHSAKLIGLYKTYLNDLEAIGVVDREVEFLPDEKTLLERKANNKGLTSPELAVLLAYSKIHIKKEILKSDAPEDPYLSRILRTAFPELLWKKYSDVVKHHHPLRREIIATQLSNHIVNEMGITFAYRMQTETGATVGEIIRAYTVASSVFKTAEFEKEIDDLGPHFPANLQYELLHYVRTLTNLATRWFLRGNHLKGNLEKIIAHYSERVKLLEDVIPDLMIGITKVYMDNIKDRFIKAGVTPDDGQRFAVLRAIYTSLNVIEVATAHKFDLVKTARVYFDVGGRFNLVWFRDQIAQDSREGHWTSLARLTLRDELDLLQKQLTVVIMKYNKRKTDIDDLIECWMNKNARALERWNKVLELLYGAPEIDYANFFIAVRELSNWVNTVEV